jgi:RNA polymerase sigma factor (sigma-70 family)
MSPHTRNMDTEIVESKAPAAGDPEARTRESLLLRVRNWGDDASWQEFFDIYWKIIYALAIRSGLSEFEAEEIVQSTMISLAKNIPTFEYDPKAGSFRAWVCTQARWKISDHIRCRAREAKVVEPHFLTSPNTPHTGTVTGTPDERNALAAFVNKEWDEALAEVALAEVKRQVSPKQFQIFDLYVVKNWPLRQISKTMKVSIANVYLTKSRIVRLLQKVKRDLESKMERSEFNAHQESLRKKP